MGEGEAKHRGASMDVGLADRLVPGRNLKVWRDIFGNECRCRVAIEGVDRYKFVDLSCKVFWAMDDDWYRGSIAGYDPATKQHRVEYEDSDVNQITLENEKIKFHISSEEMQDLHLSFSDPNMDKKAPDGDEMLALAVSFGDCQNLELGDVVWAKITGITRTGSAACNAGADYRRIVRSECLAPWLTARRRTSCRERLLRCCMRTSGRGSHGCGLSTAWG